MIKIEKLKGKRNTKIKQLCKFLTQGSRDALKQSLNDLFICSNVGKNDF